MERTPWAFVWVAMVLLLHAINVIQADSSKCVMQAASPKCVIEAASSKCNCKTTRRSDVAPARRGDLPDLESLKELLQKAKDFKDKKPVQFTYEGCVIDICSCEKILKLDLTDDKCKDVMSIPKLLRKLMGNDKVKENNDNEFMQILKKFNLDNVEVNIGNKDVKFTASAKESFDILKMEVTKAKITLDFNIKEFTYERTGFDICGEVNIGKSTAVKLSLKKCASAPVAEFKLEANQILVEDILKVFKKGNAKKSGSDSTSSSLFEEIILEKPRFEGSYEIKGDAELLITANVDKIPGMGKAEVFVNVKIAKGEKVKVGVVVKLPQLEPVKLLNLLLKKISGKDLSNVPIINDLKVDAVLAYANADMGAPSDECFSNAVKEVSDEGVIEEGTRIKFQLPLSDIVEKNGMTVAEGTDLNPYITIVIWKEKISFQFPENALMDMKNILVATIPTFTKWGLEKVFKTAKITIPTFLVNIKTKEIDIKLEAENMFTIGNGFLKLDKASFGLERDKYGKWDFGITSSIKIGDGTLDIDITKKGKKFSFVGQLDHISTSDLLDKFAKGSSIASTMNKIGAFNFGLKDLVITATFEDSLEARVKGTAIFFTWTSAKFEAYIANTDDGKEMAFGIVLTNVDMNDLAQEMFAKNGKEVDTVEAGWMSEVTVSILLGNSGDMTFETEELTAVKEAGVELPEGGGALFYVDVLIPEGCKEDALCEFVKKHIGAGQHLIMKGALFKTGFTLEVGFKGKIELTKRLALKEAGVKLSLSTSVAVSIYGEADVEMEREDESTYTITFKAELSFDATMMLKLSFTMVGIWEKPFGISWLNFGNFHMEAGINLATLLPQSFAMGGEIQLGKSDPPEITARLEGGIEIAAKPSYYVYASFSTLTIQAIIDAFEIKDVKLPKAVRDSGFPDGFSVGVSLPEGRQLDNFDVYLKSGFFIKGKIDILGYEIDCHIELDIPKKFYLKAVFDSFELAGGAIALTGFKPDEDEGEDEGGDEDEGEDEVKGSEEGPMLEICLNPESKKFSIKISAKISILSISIGAKIHISDEGINFVVQGSFMGWFTATVKVKAPFGTSLKESEDSCGNEWSFSVCIDASAMADTTKKIKDKATNEIEAANAETEKAIAEKEKDKKADEAPSNYACITISGGGNGIRKDVGKLKDDDCIAECVKLKKDDDSYNGVTMWSGDYDGCWCEQYMESVDSDSDRKACFLEASNDINGPNLGITYWGVWTNYKNCPRKQNIIGFRLKVETNRAMNDDTALNGIQLKCEDGSETRQVDGEWGEWRPWKMCTDGAYVTHMSVRGEVDNGGGDDWGATDVRMRCSDEAKLWGGGLPSGEWAGPDTCPEGYYFCGVRAKIETGGSDATSVNRIQMHCCNPNIVEIQPVYKCTWVGGMGAGGENEFVWIEDDDPEGDYCVRACGKKKLTDDSINGVTIQPMAGACWCHYNMGTVNGDDRYKTCWLNPATPWSVSAKQTIDKWYSSLQQAESNLLKEIQNINDAKKEMDQDCVKKCDKDTIMVGGIVERECNIGGQNVICPEWREKCHTRPNPWCLADCHKDKGWFAGLWEKIKGGWKLLYLKYLELKMSIGHDVLEGLKGVVDFAEALTKLAAQAGELLNDIIEKGKGLLETFKNYIIEHVFYLKTFCIKAQMGSWKNGMCFSFDADVYIGGYPNGTHYEFKDEKACMTTEWLKEIAIKLAKKVFGGMDTVLEGVEKVKELKKEMREKEEILQKERDKVDGNGKKYGNAQEDDAKKRMNIPSRADEVLEGFPDEMVTRDDRMVQAFRDVFSIDDDDEEECTVTRAEVDENSNFMLANGVQIDPISLADSSNANLCKRTQDVVNTYAGAADTINFMSARGEAVKTQYTNFLTHLSNKFIKVEAEIRNMSITNEWDADEEEDAMYFVNKAKKGIANWKENYDRKYTVMDQAGLQRWRGYMADVASQNQMDVASLLNVLSTASKETAKRMEVPNSANLEKSLTTAEKAIRDLLGNDSATLSSKKATIGQLANEVNNIKEMAKEHPCFQKA